MAGASEPVDVSTKQRRIAELARQSPEMGFTSLAHFIDIDWLREAYRRTRKDGAVGVDGENGEIYAVNLEGNLQSLLDLFLTVYSGIFLQNRELRDHTGGVAPGAVSPQGADGSTC
jgi:hypothetical protein